MFFSLWIEAVSTNQCYVRSDAFVQQCKHDAKTKWYATRETLWQQSQFHLEGWEVDRNRIETCVQDVFPQIIYAYFRSSAYLSLFGLIKA